MFDVLTIAALADELTDVALDGRIQRVGHLDSRTIAAEIYTGGRRRYLTASADAERPRIYLSNVEPSFDAQYVTPLLLLLRKYVRGGYFVAVQQPPLDRVLRLSIAKRLRPHNGAFHETTVATEAENMLGEELDDDGLQDAVYVHLYIEIMGRHSNLILVDDSGAIMESVKRVTTSMSRVRPIQPRLPYTPPPPMERPDPRRLTAAQAGIVLSSDAPGTLLATSLTRRLRGVSPQMAREIVFRSFADVNVMSSAIQPEDWAIVARETRNLFEPLLTSAWNPRVYRDDEETVVAFSPIPLAYLAATLHEQSAPTISAAAELADESSEATPVRHSQRRDRLVQMIKTAQERVESRLSSLRAEAVKASDVELFREWGETIYGYLWNIEPGQKELVVDDKTIPLDPGSSAKENAQSYFERYRKAQSAGAHLPQLREKAEQEREYLDQLRTQVEHAQQLDVLETLAAEWEAYLNASGRTEKSKPPKRSSVQRRPRAMIDQEGNAIYIGRSGTENDAVTFDIAGPDDTWLHARGVPGSHVIVRWHDPSAEEDVETLEQAASLAAFYSASRGSGTVEVDATRRRFVRKIKGTGPGMVTYRNERTLAVRPKDEATLGLGSMAKSGNQG